MKYSFKKDIDYENRFDHIRVNFEVETVCLDVLIDAFSDFVVACGFCPEGRLMYVVDEKSIEEED